MTRDMGALEDALVMAPSYGRRFSGINATLESVVPVQRRNIPIAVCGNSHSSTMPVTGLWKWLASSKASHWRIWHSRRNNDMIAGLILKYILRRKLILLWTSTAQRRHTWFTRFLYHRMDALIASTKKAASFLELPAPIVKHGIVVDNYQPPQSRQQARARCGLEERKTIGVYGRIRPQKGTCDLVEALVQTLPHQPDWQVVFVGESTQDFLGYRAELGRKLDAAGIADRVKFVGYLKNVAEVPQWYQAADVVACASRVEGYGLTCLEGMASGCPVVATTAGAWPEMITPGRNGWLCNTSDPASLADGLRQVFDTPLPEIQSAGMRGRQDVIARFSIEKEAEGLNKIYAELFEQFGETLDITREETTTRRAA